MKSPFAESISGALGRKLGGWVSLVALVLASRIGAADAPPIMPVGGLCAHRGGGVAFPENTLPALQNAARLGAQMVEFDLALTSDGELVLMHDRTVNRTTNGKGRVSDLTLAEIKKLDAGAWKKSRFAGTRVPTFAEALAVLPRDVWLNVDLKADGRFEKKDEEIARRVASLLVADGRKHQAILAVRADAATALRREASGLLMCGMDRTPDPTDYVREAIAQHVDFIQLRDCATDPRLAGWLKELKAAHIRINYFYANDPDAVLRLLKLGIDFVLVDDLARVQPRVPGIERRSP